MISGMYRHNLQCLVQGCPRLLGLKDAARTSICSSGQGRNSELLLFVIKVIQELYLNRMQYDMVTTVIEYNKLDL